MIQTGCQGTIRLQVRNADWILFRITRKIFSGLQKQFTLLRIAIVLALSLTLLSVLLTLLYSSCLRKTQHLKRRLKIADILYADNYQLARATSDPSSAITLMLEMRNASIELDARKDTLSRYCKELGKTEYNLDNVFSNLVIDLKHGISWCPIYKAASSTWMRNFAILSGRLTETTIDLIHRGSLQINTIVRQSYPRDPDIRNVHEKLNQTKNFLIVRHPFERLVSAYRDKLEHKKGREYYYKRFGRHITHKYHRYRESNETQLEPTFGEFLRFLVEEKYFDEHWSTYSDACGPCAIRYDYILKFETFDRDQRFLVHELGLMDSLSQVDDLKNRNPRGLTTSAVVQKYIDNLPRSLVDKVNKIYEKDYKFFSYLPV